MKIKKLTKLIAFTLVIASAFSLSSCSFLGGIANAFPGLGFISGLFGPTCDHTTGGNGNVITIDGTHYLRGNCIHCGEQIDENLNVISYSEKWLYDESSHWHDVKAQNFGGSQDSVSFKGEFGYHDFNENGVCEVCGFSTCYSSGLEFVEQEDGLGYLLAGLGSCNDTHINIPSEHNGKPVVGIGDGALNPPKKQQDNGQPDGEEAEQEKSRVVGITIPDTVLYISCTAFSQCDNLVNFIVNPENEVFDSINNCLIDTTIGSLVRGCEFSVIPNDGSVTIIGSYAFANSDGLVSITIPDSVQEIGDKAFFECEGLIEITMPENINIGIDVFRGSIHVEIKIEHNLEYIPAKEATCEEAGNINHFVCKDCGYFFADQMGEQRLYEVTIPASHEFIDGICQKCQKVMDSILIVSVDQIPALGKFPLGTLENAIGLPSTINAYTKDGKKHELAVAWDLSAYDKSQVGTYTITGVIQSGVLQFDQNTNKNITASIEIVEFMKGTADIVFILDISGSMGEEIGNVKNNIVNFAAAIEAQGVSARWSAITYSDWTCSTVANEQSTIIKNGTSDWFITAEEYKSAINRINLANGGDFEETAIDGMMLANTQLSTRQDARVFYVLLTDATNKVSNHYNVTSLTDCAQRLDQDGVNVSVITTTSYFSHYSVLTDTTGGIQSNINGNFSQDLLDNLVPIIYGEVIA